MKTMTVVEMQTRLCEILAQQETEVTQVTYQGKPVVAVLALARYQALLTQVTDPQGKPVVAVLALERYQAPQSNLSDQPAIEVAREAITQAQRLFHSYSNWLAPRFQGQEHLIKIIEVTRRKKPVGALLAWNDWQRFSAPTQAEEPILNDFVLPITAARNHLLKLPEQFAREEQTGRIARPVTVIKQEEPLLVIVSWQWFELVTHALHALVEPDEAIRRILVDVPSPLGNMQGELLPEQEGNS